MTTKPFAERIAGAPISWGVCEVPGWGEMLPPSRVLPEMTTVGLSATELGAPGFLPSEASEVNSELSEYGFSLIGGFVPLVLHDPAVREEMLASAEQTARLFQSCGATYFVTAVVQDMDWSRPIPLDDEGMRILGEGLRQVDEICARYGLIQVLHPHVDTLVETADDVQRALKFTDVQWCLDTGHLAIGGTDPVAFARENADRVGHVHLKDVNLALAPKVLEREIGLMQAVQAGLFQPLGSGDVALDEVILTLEKAGYQGWYVLEQDCALTDVPVPGAGPILEVARSMDYLKERVAPFVA